MAAQILETLESPLARLRAQLHLEVRYLMLGHTKPHLRTYKVVRKCIDIFVFAAKRMVNVNCSCCFLPLHELKVELQYQNYYQT